MLSQEDIDAWKETLECKVSDNQEDFKRARGFYFEEAHKHLLFSNLYRFLVNNDVEPKISDAFYQMKFKWSEKLEKLEASENCPEIEGLKGDSDADEEETAASDDLDCECEVKLIEIE